MMAPAFNTDKKIEVIKTVASQKEGIVELANAIEAHQQHISINNRKIWLLTERVYQLIARNRMKPYDKKAIYQALQAKASKEQFNLFTFVNEYANTGNA